MSDTAETAAGQPANEPTPTECDLCKTPFGAGIQPHPLERGQFTLFVCDKCFERETGDPAP